MARAAARTSLTVAGGDLAWLMSVLQATQGTFTVTVVEDPHPVATRIFGDGCDPHAAIVEIDETSAATDVRALLERSPKVRFLFMVRALPLRHAVARVIREGGHAVLSRSERPFVIAATVTALMVEREVG
jgi:hypothetical protein